MDGNAASACDKAASYCMLVKTSKHIRFRGVGDSRLELLFGLWWRLFFRVLIGITVTRRQQAGCRRLRPDTDTDVR